MNYIKFKTPCNKLNNYTTFIKILKNKKGETTIEKTIAGALNYIKDIYVYFWFKPKANENWISYKNKIHNRKHQILLTYTTVSEQKNDMNKILNFEFSLCKQTKQNDKFDSKSNDKELLYKNDKICNHNQNNIKNECDILKAYVDINNHKIIVCIDTGSNVNIKDKNLANNLGLKIQKCDEIEIIGFNYRTEKTKHKTNFMLFIKQNKVNIDFNLIKNYLNQKIIIGDKTIQELKIDLTKIN